MGRHFRFKQECEHFMPVFSQTFLQGMLLFCFMGHRLPDQQVEPVQECVPFGTFMVVDIPHPLLQFHGRGEGLLHLARPAALVLLDEQRQFPGDMREAKLVGFGRGFELSSQRVTHVNGTRKSLGKMLQKRVVAPGFGTSDICLSGGLPGPSPTLAAVHPQSCLITADYVRTGDRFPDPLIQGEERTGNTIENIGHGTLAHRYVGDAAYQLRKPRHGHELAHAQVTHQRAKVVPVLYRRLDRGGKLSFVAVPAATLHPVRPMLGDNGLDGWDVHHLAFFQHVPLGGTEHPAATRATGGRIMLPDNIRSGRHLQCMARMAGLAARLASATGATLWIPRGRQVLRRGKRAVAARGRLLQTGNLLLKRGNLIHEAFDQGLKGQDDIYQFILILVLELFSCKSRHLLFFTKFNTINETKYTICHKVIINKTASYQHKSKYIYILFF